MNKPDARSSTSQLSAAVSGRMAASRLFVIAALIASLGALTVDLMRKKETFFVDTTAGDSIEVFPLTEPNVTPSSLTKWVTQGVTSAYTLDFYQYQDTIDGLKEYFTAGGYKTFLESLQDSGSLNKIIKDKLVVSAVATNAAIILQEGMMNGVYTWKIQVPLLLNYQGASTTSTQKNIAVSVLVTRVQTSEAPKGIGIAQIVDEEYHVPI